MRVVITKDNQTICHLPDRERLDLQEDPAAIVGIDGARKYPAFGALLANLNAEESPFSTFACKIWSASEDGASEPSTFASRIDLFVRERAEELSLSQYEDLANRLAELLQREPGDALEVELAISPAEFAGGSEGFCLRLLLFAHGKEEKQAQVRWTLGLARVQQALLFLARAIRQKRLSTE